MTSDQTGEDVSLLVTEKRRDRGIISTSVRVRMQNHTENLMLNDPKSLAQTVCYDLTSLICTSYESWVLCFKPEWTILIIIWTP